MLIYNKEIEELQVKLAETKVIGIDETKDLVKLLALITNKLLQQPKINLSLGVYLIGLYSEVLAAFSGVAEVPAEVKDLDQDELLELKILFNDIIVCDRPDTEVIVENAFAVVLSLLQLFVKLKYPTVVE